MCLSLSKVWCNSRFYWLGKASRPSACAALSPPGRNRSLRICKFRGKLSLLTQSYQVNWPKLARLLRLSCRIYTVECFTIFSCKRWLKRSLCFCCPQGPSSRCVTRKVQGADHVSGGRLLAALKRCLALLRSLPTRLILLQKPLLKELSEAVWSLRMHLLVSNFGLV